jgi:hypothetical protein
MNRRQTLAILFFAALGTSLGIFLFLKHWPMPERLLSIQDTARQAKSVEFETIEIGGNPDEYTKRILTTSGKEQARLLTQFEENSYGSYGHVKPQELQFSDAIGLDPYEEAWGDLLEKSEPKVQVVAGRVLWQKHSRRFSIDVLQIFGMESIKTEGARALQRIIEKSLLPENILDEIEEGDYRWGSWLAYLRPHSSFVPTLLDNLKKKPDLLPETILALGKSRDRRAFDPLSNQLKADDYVTTGFAAVALGYLGLPEAEPLLIDALLSENTWLQVKACRALSMIGTRKSLPALEQLAKDDCFKGIMNVRGMARLAADSIEDRERP